MATKERILRITVLQYKSSKLTDDEFHKHWTQKHAPIASGWLARNGILGYTQVRPQSATKAYISRFVGHFGVSIM